MMKRNITKKTVEMLVFEITGNLHNHKWIVPPWQRINKKWSNAKKSQFIEQLYSVEAEEYLASLMSLTVATFKDAKGRKYKLLIDGLQRITAFNSFKNGEFKLSGKTNPELKGLTFNDLYDKIERTLFEVDFIEVENEGEAILKYVEINSGVPLNGKELRLAFFDGFATRLFNKFFMKKLESKQNNFVKKIIASGIKGFGKAIESKTIVDILMRYIAIKEAGFTGLTKQDLTKRGYSYASKEMSDEKIEKTLKDVTKSFENIIQIFGRNAFKNYSYINLKSSKDNKIVTNVQKEAYISRFNEMTILTLLLAFDGYSMKQLKPHKIEIVEAYKQACLNGDLVFGIKNDHKDNAYKTISVMRNIVENAVGKIPTHSQDDIDAIKDFLFQDEETAICHFCGKQLDDIDECEVHHKTRKKDFGLDTLENLCLACSTCHKDHH